MLESLKKQVCAANLDLVAKGVVIYTWGNVSGIDRERRLVVIKPSGIDYEGMKPEDMVVVDLITGKVVEGKWQPSSDTKTHLELYKAFPNIGGIAHTHSINAVAFAQAGIDICALGTTHADYFYGDIPCTRALTKMEIENDYELNTGKVIIETFENKDPEAIPGVLVFNHAPFSWGLDPAEAVHNAVVLEEVAKMAFRCEIINHDITRMGKYILDKHYHRKHGKSAYYGQNN